MEAEVAEVDEAWRDLAQEREAEVAGLQAKIKILQEQVSVLSQSSLESKEETGENEAGAPEAAPPTAQIDLTSDRPLHEVSLSPARGGVNGSVQNIPLY